MPEHNVVTFELPDTRETPGDALTVVLRKGARELIAAAVEAEVTEFVAQYQQLRDPDGRQRVVRNGYLPERELQTGIGAVPVKVPRVRDRGGEESNGSEKASEKVSFTSTLVPPYLRRSRSLDELLPALYLRGISTGNFSDALAALLGAEAPGLSASTISRLKQQWASDHADWSRRDLSRKRYVYVWADGIHCNVRLDDARLCVLVLIGATEDGRKEVIAVEDGVRESEQSWLQMLTSLKARGLELAPKLAIGDGALGFWKAMSKVYGETRHQRCWFHKMGNVLNYLPKSGQPKAKEMLQEIWMAENRKGAEKAFEAFLETFSAKYPKSTDCLAKDKVELLAFYDFPAEHWKHIRTTNPIESTFSTVRQRTSRTRGCLTRATMLPMVFKLCQAAEKNWRRLTGYAHLAEVVRGIRFIDGIHQDRIAA